MSLFCGIPLSFRCLDADWINLTLGYLDRPRVEAVHTNGHREHCRSEGSLLGNSPRQRSCAIQCPLGKPSMIDADTRFDRSLSRLYREDPKGRSQYHAFNSVIDGSQYRPLYRACAQLLAPGQTVLDWGVGDGHFSLFLRSLPLAVHGYAIENRLPIDLVEDRQYHFTRGSDPVKLPYSDNTFDAAFSVGVLEHVRYFGGDEMGSLRELFRVLNPGGHLLIFHFPRTYSWIEWTVARFFPTRYHHHFRYRRHQAVGMCTDAGFEVLFCRRYAILPRNRAGRVVPRFLADAEWLRAVYDAADVTISAALPWFTQNLMLVLRRPL
jgi:SAM-dependent methyltransferase